jgi:hypothetical protein
MSEEEKDEAREQFAERREEMKERWNGLSEEEQAEKRAQM